MRKLHLSIILSSALLLTLCGCSEVGPNIFNGIDKNAISPIISFQTKNEQGYTVIDETYRGLASAILSAKGVEYMRDGAGIVNSHAELLKIVEESPYDLKYPEVDFSTQSLVVSKFCKGSSGYFVDRQRVKVSDNSSKLYIEVLFSGGGLTTCCQFYTMAVYPKLPDGKIELVRFDNY